MPFDLLCAESNDVPGCFYRPPQFTLLVPGGAFILGSFLIFVIIGTLFPQFTSFVASRTFLCWVLNNGSLLRVAPHRKRSCILVSRSLCWPNFGRKPGRALDSKHQDKRVRAYRIANSSLAASIKASNMSLDHFTTLSKPLSRW